MFTVTIAEVFRLHRTTVDLDLTEQVLDVVFGKLEPDDEPHMEFGGECPLSFLGLDGDM